MREVILPNEIWLEIFKKIRDWRRWMELRLVCHRFYDLIEDLLNKNIDWKELAYDSIYYECLENTAQRAHPYVLVSHWSHIHDPVFWRMTYLSYKKWQKVLVNSHTKATMVPMSNFRDISCVCTFDKYIAIAFHNGLIANYTIDNISQPFYLTNHGTSVHLVEFWYSNGEVLVVSVGDDNTLKFWDLQNQIEIATNGFLANSICSGECRHLCIGNMGGILTSYERVGNHISPKLTLNLELRDEQILFVHAVGYTNMLAVAWKIGFTKLLMCHGAIEGGKLIELYTVDLRTDWNCLPENLSASIRRFTIPTFSFLFGIGGNHIGSIHYSERKWHEYNLGQHFGCNVKSIALHAEIMMFGLEDGSIHLLHVPHYGYVRKRRDLEERIKHSKKIQVDTMPIVDLTVLQVDMKTCIVAVTDQKVHLINFF